MPTWTGGDAYDRFRVLLEEIAESMKVIDQALDKIAPQGDYVAANRKVALPSRREIYGNGNFNTSIQTGNYGI